MTEHSRLIVGITGASGAVYGLCALDLLRALGVETHLVTSRAAALTLSSETDLSLADLHSRADVVHKTADVGASIASGSFKTLGMLIAPCSMRTVSAIAYGGGDNLLVRAADVVLKERRRLVLMTRESPLHLGHLRAMAQATEMGAVIAPPAPAFYAKPKTIEEMVEQTVARTLDLFELDAPQTRRWGEDLPTLRSAPKDGE